MVRVLVVALMCLGAADAFAAPKLPMDVVVTRAKWAVSKFGATIDLDATFTNTDEVETLDPSCHVSIELRFKGKPNQRFAKKPWYFLATGEGIHPGKSATGSLYRDLVSHRWLAYKQDPAEFRLECEATTPFGKRYRKGRWVAEVPPPENGVEFSVQFRRTR